MWSPDGKLLYFASDRGGSMNLWRMAIDEETGKPQGVPESVTTPASSLAHPTIHTMVPAWRKRSSPEPKYSKARVGFDGITDGRADLAHDRIASVVESGYLDRRPMGSFLFEPAEENIHIVRTDGTGLRQLTSEPTIMDRVPRWSPDGDWVAYFSNRSGTYQVWKIRRDGSDLQQLTEADDDVRYPTWAPDGARMAITVIGKTPEAGHVYVFDPNRPWKQQTPAAPSTARKPFRSLRRQLLVTRR